MNYAELVQAIQDETEVSEATFVDNIPFMVKRAEERLYRFIKLPKLRKVDTSISTVQGTRTITMPADFLSVDSLSVVSSGVYYHLIPKEPDFVREAYGTVSFQGRPIIYALRDHQTVVLGPTPDAAYNMELVYTHKPESIVTASTTWIGDNAENALFSACMSEALVFLKELETPEASYWEARFKESVGTTKILGEGKDRTDEFRNSPPRAPQAT